MAPMVAVHHRWHGAVFAAPAGDISATPAAAPFTAPASIIFTAEADDVLDPGALLPFQRGLWGGLVLLGNTVFFVAYNGTTGFEIGRSSFWPTRKSAIRVAAEPSLTAKRERP